MKRVYFTFLMLIFGLLAQAQNISVSNFYYDENDLTPRTYGTSEEDQNGNLCAIIKVRTTEKGLWTFDVGMLGVTKTEMQNASHAAEIWVWVPFGVTRITIQHEKFGLLDKWRFPCSINKGCTYVMELDTESGPVPPPSGPRQGYLLFQLDPPNAILEVDDKLWNVEADGTSMKYVDFGTYSYRVRASDYFTEVGKVTVDDPENTKIVPVKLKSNLIEVTMTVDADAEIWVNNQRKGTRTWTGKLGNGTYKIECKQAGHETTMVSKDITAEMNGETIILPVPTPIYGSLNVESTPNLATIYIDGKEMGKTPKSISQILVGQHEIKLTQDGYADHVETITVAKGERKQVKATLSNGKEIHFTCNVPNAQLEIDGQRVGFATGNYQLTYGSHSLKATADDYRDYTYTINVSESGGRSHNIQMKGISCSGTYNGHDYVDLGLPSGTLWATCNVGANVPEDYGDYFAWGETMPKGIYDWRTYKYCKGRDDQLTKYCNNPSYGYNGFTDNLTELQSSDDAATANWGSGWCMPTKTQWEELKNNTTVTWTMQNGVKGMKFTAGNGNSLFLPAAGYRFGSDLNSVGLGFCWSSSLYTDGPYVALQLYFNSDGFFIIDKFRYSGRSVRPVRSAQN